MKKQLLSLVLVFPLFFISLESNAQNSISVGVEKNNLKTVSKARSQGYTNTVTPVAVGIGMVSLFENNTIETLGAGLTVYGLVVGPSTANFYAQDYKRGALGVTARAVGAYLMKDATREIFGNDFADALTVDNKEVSLTDTKILIGEAIILGSLIYNIVSAKASVQEYNQGGRFSFRINSKQVGNKAAPVLTAQFRF